MDNFDISYDPLEFFKQWSEAAIDNAFRATLLSQVSDKCEREKLNKTIAIFESYGFNAQKTFEILRKISTIYMEENNNE